MDRHTDRRWWNWDEARWECRPSLPGEAPSVPERALVDVRDMIVVHTALLREFRLLPAAVRHTPPGDRKRVAAVAHHLRFLSELLHHHHAGEDALLWPKLRERTTEASSRLIDRVEAQHIDIDVALRRVGAACDDWADKPDAARREELAVRLSALHEVLRDHLDLEERALLPLAAALLTEDEWHAIGKAAAAATPKRSLPLLFGMFAYEGDPPVITGMLRSAPPLPRLLLPRVAAGSYARRCRHIHGTARP
jgi:hemerythrin-like domain-containing protein